MCGIAGLVGDFVPEFGRVAIRALAHRGPDGDGLYENAQQGVTLAHTRLAIIDLSSAAAQPMRSRDGRYVLIFNGEVYNYRDLRSDLVARGYQFISTGDTEVLLAGLAAFGAAYVKRLNGIFAFALWDAVERTLLLARDQLGVKPLYYAEPRPGVVVFASEIKALYAYPAFGPKVDFGALQQHLAYCHASSTRTAFANVKRLPPGHMATLSPKERALIISRFWSPPFERSQSVSRGRAVEVLRDEIQQAVHRQMVADVPVAAFLSGGLDSSVLTVHAAQHAEGRFTAFTTKFAKADEEGSQERSDLFYARQLAHQLRVDLVEVEVSARSIELLPKMIYHLDEPLVDPAILSCHLLSQAAKERGATVLLSGQGGDELFCGYPRYLVMHATRHVERLPPALRRLIGATAQALPAGRPGRIGMLGRRIRRALSGIDGSAEMRFLNMCANTSQSEVTRALSPAFQEAVAGESFADDCLRHMKEEGLQGLQELQERDLTIYLPNHNLLYTDKICMASGIEARVPLLDIGIVGEAVRYPYDWQLSGLRTKALFRDAARGIVPDNIIRRSKAGFGAPFRQWLRHHDCDEIWNDLAGRAAVENRGWFSFDALQDARRRSGEGLDDLFMLQWAAITMELWARTFLDTNPLKKMGIQS